MSEFLIEDILNSKGRVKILKVLTEQGELNISKIAELAELNHSTTISHLDALERAQLVKHKEFGRIKIYKFRDDHAQGQALKQLFKTWNGGGVGEWQKSLE